ncbi:MAG: 6-bladed beta-propeller [Prevotellaceae bacterium]|jgi:hypothetical protein|nr:6-bladed beta-propeller [Prevotellaceae bacterium]
MARNIMCEQIIKKLYFFALLLTLTISCNSDRKKETVENNSVYTVDFDNIPKEEKIYMSSLFKKVRSIPLETVDESLIGYINEVQVFDGKIFVFDRDYTNSVFVFDMDGKFIRKIGRTGQGPGEYIDLRDFTIDEINHEIYLMVTDGNCIMIYDIDTGKFIKRINLSERIYSHYIQYSNGRLYADANGKSESKENRLLHEIDKQTGEYKDSWLPADCNKGWMETMSYNSFFFSRNSPHSPKYAQLFMDTVFSIEKEGLIPFLAVKSSRWPSKNDFEKANYEVEKIGNIIDNKIYCISNFIEYKDIILFTLGIHEQYHVLCDNRNGRKNVRIAGFLTNDLLFEGERFGIWRLCCSDEKRVYSILPIEHLSFTENLGEKIKKDLPDREKLLNLKEDDNPVILYFEYE